MLAIVQQCAKEQDVQSGKAIRIYVGGNINGVLTPQLVNQSELGGMDRMAGFMQQMKNKYANVFVLDIGNPFGTTTSKPEYDIIHQAYKTMGHDAVFLSAKDRAGWLQFVQAPPTLNWLRTGLYAKGQLPLTQEYTFANKQLQVKVVAVGGLGGAGSLPDTINPVGAYANILKEQHASWSSHPSAVIAIVEGSPMLAEALANQLTFVDIIIVTGEKAGPPMVVRSGKTAIFSVGTGGTHIGKITILADQGDQADLANLANSIHTIRPSFEWIPMDRTVASHKEIFAKQQALYHSSVEKNNMQFINKHTFEDFLTLHAADSGGRQDIWYHPVEGKAFRATKSPLWIQSAGVAWSRDRLFYVGRSNPSDPNRIYIQNTKQKTAHAIGDSLLDVRKGQWGAFENWIYFTAFDSLKNAALYRVAASGSHQQIVSPAEWSDCYDFSLSYKGAFIAMVKGSPLHSDVYHTALGAPVPVQVTNGLVRVKNVEYSYDEKYLAFLSAPKLQKQNDIGQKDVWELTIWDIEKDTILTPLPGRSINDFIWGVDNRSIVFNDGVNVQDIRTYHLDTKQEVSIYSARGESVRNEDQPRVQFYKSQPGILFRLRNEQGTSIQWYNWQTKQIVPRTLLQQSTGLTLP
jgi:hypothetical protein